MTVFRDVDLTAPMDDLGAIAGFLARQVATDTRFELEPRWYATNAVRWRARIYVGGMVAGDCEGDTPNDAVAMLARMVRGR